MELDEIKAKKQDLKQKWKKETLQQTEDERLLNLEMKQKLQEKHHKRYSHEIQGKLDGFENVDWHSKFIHLEKMVLEMNKQHEEDQILIQILREELQQSNGEKEKLKKQLSDSKKLWNIKFDKMQTGLKEFNEKIGNLNKAYDENTVKEEEIKIAEAVHPKYGKTQSALN